MARTPVEGLQNDIRDILQTHTKGLSIEEISTCLSISRTTTAKYLNAMEQTGQIESRPYGPAKVYTLVERVPVNNLLSLLPHPILMLDDSLVIKQINESFLNFFQLSEEELIGRDIRYSPLGAYMSEARLDLLNQAINGEPQFIEEDITRNNVTTFFYIRIAPTLFEQGTKGIVIILEDITQLKNTLTHMEELVKERTTELETVNKKIGEENTRYKKVREELEFSKHQYEQLVENSTDLILKFSSKGELIFSNTLAAKVLGIDSPEKKYFLKGVCIPDIPDMQEFADSLIDSLLVGRDLIKRKEIEYFIANQPIWISWTFKKISPHNRSSPEILCIGTDVSERVQSERKLKESEHSLSGVINHLPDPTFVIDTDRRVILWNKAMEEMTGVRSEHVIGKERSLFTPSIFGYSRPILADFVFDPDNIEIKRFFQNMTKEDGVLTAETKGIGKDGKEVIFWVKASPLMDVEGTTIGAIQSMRDITSIRTLENALIKSEELVRNILNASKDLIVVLSADRQYIFVNKAYEIFFNCDGKELKGTHISEIPLPGDAEFWRMTLDSVMRTRLGNRVELSFSYQSRDICLDCYLIPFFRESSGEMQILLDFRDITRLKGKETTLWEDEITLQEIG
ncbi:MAG: PAS domain S-box protein, partial [Methanospirillum sp.]|uniref:PAS domain S-box protein n=1 Tax=Methanospirillum sp. TaxID=45200 RepID=UPI00237008FA